MPKLDLTSILIQREAISSQEDEEEEEQNQSEEEEMDSDQRKDKFLQ